MKAVHLQKFGSPSESVACVEVEEPAAPGPGEAQFDVLVFPINPADVLLTEGLYAAKPPLPARLGAECLGRVTAVGEGVTDLAVGDRVINLARDNWVQRQTLARTLLVKVPDDSDPVQLSMLKVNPATAMLMLHDYVQLAEGDWVIQNAANSAVGGYVIRLAKSLGYKTINIVRREGLAQDLKTAGADHVLLDGPDLAERVNATIGERQVALGIDAVAGSVCQRMANCMRDGSVLVNYGMLSGEPCQIDPSNLVFAGVSLKGFWLAKTLLSMTPEGAGTLYSDLGDLVRSGDLAAPVEAVYDIEEINVALEHAARGGREGKVLVTPNGPLN